MNTYYDAIVIGAGLAGVFTAIELGKKGFKVALLERGKEILGEGSSSFNQSYRLHTGIHYVGDVQTALQNLRSTVGFIRQYPSAVLGYENPSLPWRRGRYYLLSDSFFNEDEVKSICTSLQKEYQRLVELDKGNKVLGDPKELIQYLKDSKIHPSVTLAIETKESQLDILRLRHTLLKQIDDLEKVTLITLGNVQDVSMLSNGYRLETDTNVFYSKGVVNCTWSNIEEIDVKLGFRVDPDILIREKVSVLISLPKELINMNTSMFFAGPFCSLTNLGNGQAIVTYEPKTNTRSYFIGRPEEKELFNSYKENESLGEDILNGAAKFIPELSKSTLLEIRRGHVKIFDTTEDPYTIYEKKSFIHKRRETGIEKKNKLYFSHSGIKATYAMDSAKAVAELFEKDFLHSSLPNDIC